MTLSFYTRARSPWVWVQWSIGPGHPRKCERTTIRANDRDVERKKALLRLDWQRKLLLGNRPKEAMTKGAESAAQGWAWVVSYLAIRYRARPKTLQIYEIEWRHVWEFLAKRKIDCPALLRREDCFDYVTWRTAQVKPSSGRSPGINTALHELKLLRLLMAEAMARGLATENPASKLNIEADEITPKPDITDLELAKIYEALEREPQWMQRSFFLAANTGLRFASTRLHRSQLRWDEGRILIERPKGGRKREFALEIYPAIEPMLRAWWESGEPWLWSAPAAIEKVASLSWTQFFRRIGLAHLCFHCTRVAFITRGAQRGVPESAMCAMVNHGSREIHRIYQRWKPSGFREFAEQIAPAVPAPAFAGASSQSRQRKTSSRPASAGSQEKRSTPAPSDNSPRTPRPARAR